MLSRLVALSVSLILKASPLQVNLHHRENPAANGIMIYIADSNGQDVPWSTINSWMQVVCQGSAKEDAFWGVGLPSGGLPSGAIIPSADADLEKGFMFAGLYCHYERAAGFDNCPDVHVYDGAANFDTGSAAVRGGVTNILTIPFSVPFASDPMCIVLFENVWLHHRVHTDPTSVTITIADENEQPAPWVGVSTWMQVACYGVATATPPGETTFGQMGSSTIVPNAAADLDAPYAFSAMYCTVTAGRMDPTCAGTFGAPPHAWGGKANFAPAETVVDGNSLRVVFVKPYIGDPFCRVSFEDVYVHHRQDTYPTGLNIMIADSNGQDVPWSTITTDIQIICHGVAVSSYVREGAASLGSVRLSSTPQGRIEVFNENVGGWGKSSAHLDMVCAVRSR